ncbi:hypothetical protein [Paeniglutamicibacter kerguelensis]|uniref:Uncharacterized protein n=1 Tax=Paeniglutamicibacter kerguelensis TaxID=254788 RepID=A0ABS4XEC7_9MICC|nr:hypothetical protein [Paeniglutamicibacter kerguelensis]MBP2386824.1 hypothetical protein [Paeniglutamicibacter kerguelensis]
MQAFGRHGGGEQGPYGHEPGAFGNGLLPFLAWWHQHLFEPIGDFFSDTADKVRGIRRSRRWLICWALGILTLGFSGLIVIAVAEGNNRDFAIVTTQVADEGVLIGTTTRVAGWRSTCTGST